MYGRDRTLFDHQQVACTTFGASSNGESISAGPWYENYVTKGSVAKKGQPRNGSVAKNKKRRALLCFLGQILECQLSSSVIFVGVNSGVVAGYWKLPDQLS